MSHDACASGRSTGPHAARHGGSNRTGRATGVNAACLLPSAASGDRVSIIAQEVQDLDALIRAEERATQAGWDPLLDGSTVVPHSPLDSSSGGGRHTTSTTVASGPSLLVVDRYRAIQRDLESTRDALVAAQAERDAARAELETQKARFQQQVDELVRESAELQAAVLADVEALTTSRRARAMNGGNDGGADGSDGERVSRQNTESSLIVAALRAELRATRAALASEQAAHRETRARLNAVLEGGATTVLLHDDGSHSGGGHTDHVRMRARRPLATRKQHPRASQRSPHHHHHPPTSASPLSLAATPPTSRSRGRARVGGRKRAQNAAAESGAVAAARSRVLRSPSLLHSVSPHASSGSAKDPQLWRRQRHSRVGGHAGSRQEEHRSYDDHDGDVVEEEEGGGAGGRGAASLSPGRRRGAPPPVEVPELQALHSARLRVTPREVTSPASPGAAGRTDYLPASAAAGAGAGAGAGVSPPAVRASPVDAVVTLHDGRAASPESRRKIWSALRSPSFRDLPLGGFGGVGSDAALSQSATAEQPCAEQRPGARKERGAGMLTLEALAAGGAHDLSGDTQQAGPAQASLDGAAAAAAASSKTAVDRESQSHEVQQQARVREQVSQLWMRISHDSAVTMPAHRSARFHQPAVMSPARRRLSAAYTAKQCVGTVDAAAGVGAGVGAGAARGSPSPSPPLPQAAHASPPLPRAAHASGASDVRRRRQTMDPG